MDIKEELILTIIRFHEFSTKVNSTIFDEVIKLFKLYGDYINNLTDITNYIKKLNNLELYVLLKHISNKRNSSYISNLSGKCEGLFRLLKLQMENIDELNINVDLVNTINKLKEENEKLKAIIKMI